MKTRTPIAAVILLLIVLQNAVAAHTPQDESYLSVLGTDLTSTHPVYPLLDRIEARGLFKHPLPGIRPYSIHTVLGLTAEALASGNLSDTERQRLRRYHDALSKADTSQSSIRRGTLYRYKDEILAIEVSPLVSQRLLFERDTAPDETVSQTRIGLGLSGGFHKHFSFRLQHFEGRESSSISRRTREDVRFAPLEAVQLKGKTADFRESRYQINIALPWFSLDFGKESIGWGPSRGSNLFLRQTSPSYPYGRLRVSHKALTFEHVFAVLRTAPDDLANATTTVDNGHRRTVPGPKRLVAHRLEIALSDRLNLGIHEAVIFGGRRFDAVYAVPVSILVGAQSFAGDTDNLAFGLDLSYRIKKNAIVYGALFFDDLAKFSPGAFSNQLGTQIGIHWTNPVGLTDVDVQAEYVRLEPYTYAHNFNINAFTHFDATLGHPIGPNADQITIRLQKLLSGSFRSWLSFSGSRRGENFVVDSNLVNVGGDPAQGRRPDDAAQRSFLAGDRFTQTHFELGFEWEASHALRLLISGHYNRVRVRPVVTGGSNTSGSRTVNVAVELNAF